MRRSFFCPLACSLLVLAVLPALGAAAQQESSSPPPEIGEVVVTATRINSPILESPNAISVITPADIESSGAHDLSSLLAGQAGTYVNDYGPEGSTKSVSLRGSTSAQVTVLLDGVRLNSSRDGLVDLSSIPMEIIDHVEVLRGSASTIYGSGAIGGVINIITKKPDAPLVSLSVTNGSYLPHAASTVSADYSVFPTVYSTATAALNPWDLLDGQNVELSLAGKLGSVGLTGGGSLTRAANAFTWLDTSQIGAWRRRINSDTLAGSGFAEMTVPLFGGTASAKALLETSDVGAPGSLTMLSNSARQTDTAASGTVAWSTDRFLTDALTLDLKAFYRHDTLTYNDPAFPPESVHHTSTAVLDVTQKLTLVDAVSAIYGGNASFDLADSTNYASSHQRLNLAGFLSVPVTLGAVTLTPSARYDWFTDFPSAVSGSLSAVLLLSDTASARASVATAYRVPTLNDLYWYDPSGYTASNPNLKPETSYAAELGFAVEQSQLSLDLSTFCRYVQDNIVWLASAPTYVYQPQNLTQTLFPGAEVRAKVAITDALAMEASYTFLYSFLLNDGNTALSVLDDRRVPYTPVHSLRIETTYSTRSFEIALTERYEALQYTDSANSAPGSMPAYFLTDARGRFAISDLLSGTIALKNIFNALYYTQLGYPMPPFSIETGVQLHL
ncbi:MAG TPA: TonB-dependent receptor [Spirochaetia bacterium]|nr:TonB-dependent receptor [Spirochaetia bacterium]